MRWLTIAIVFVGGLGCRLVNEDHCANLAGDATCSDRGDTRRYCSACTAVNDGCVAEPVAEPECAAADGSSSSSSSSTTTPAMDASSSTSADSSSSSSSSSSAEATSTPSETGDASSSESGPLTASSGEPPSAECGDGIAEGDERCDGDDLAGATCANQAEFSGGDIACGTDCELDTSMCAPCRAALALCGNDDACCSGSCNGLGVCD